MSCYQCNNYAMWQVGEKNIPLCLDCYLKYSQINQQELENHERMMNFQQDQMAAIAGTTPIGARFPPRPQPVIIAGAKLQNINVSNSVVGTINTGSIATVDQSISALVQTGESALAEAIKALSESILRSADLSKNQKNELVESLSVISKEAAKPREMRQSTVAKSLLEKSIQITNLADDITVICQKWWPVLQGAFTAVTGG